MTTLRGKNCKIMMGSTEIKTNGDWSIETGDIIHSTTGASGEVIDVRGNTITVTGTFSNDEITYEGFKETLKEFFFGGDNMQQRAKTQPSYSERRCKNMGFVPPKVPQSVLSHTRMRFDTMSTIQLWTRMGKITNPDKLVAFAIVAAERGIMDLSIAARARYAQQTGNNSMLSGMLSKPKPKKDKKTDRLLRKLDI